MTVPYQNYCKTKDSFEMHFGINHLSHLALTGLLFDKIMSTLSSHIMTVSSRGHKIGDTRIRFDDIQGVQNYKNSYGRSKLANLFFTYEMDRRLRARMLDIKLVAGHPGVAKSNLLSAGLQMAKSKPALCSKLSYLPAQSAQAFSVPFHSNTGIHFLQ